MSHYAEVLHRQGWWTTRHPDEPAATAWTERRTELEAPTVNPVREARVRPIPHQALVTNTGETVCPKCLGPVAGTVGIHYDCRDEP